MAAVVVLLLVLATAAPVFADTPWSPFVLDPARSLADQYGYVPSYTRNVPVFDAAGNAYIRSRTSSGESTSYVHTLQGGTWQALDFAATLRRSFPTMVGTAGAGGLRTDAVVFDRQDRAYNPLVVRLADGSIRNVLMVSWDHCRSWSVFRLPDGEQFSMEDWVGHNQIDGPPFLAVCRRSGQNPASRATRFSLWVTKPRLDGHRLVIPPLTHVSDDCLGLSKDSGGSSFAVTHNGVTTFIWAEATPQGAPATLQFVATYDAGSRTVSPSQLVFASRPANDIHCKPGICVDSKGYLHVVSGTHATAVEYRRSLAPDTVMAGWTPSVPVLGDGYANVGGNGAQRGRQTYDAFVCDSKDVLHLVTRQNRAGADAYFGGAPYAALIHQSCPSAGAWGPPTLIVVGAEPGYAVFFHKLALDHRDRLFLSCSCSGGEEREQAQARSAVRRVLGRSAVELGKYQRRMVLVSDDGGTQWRLAADADLVAPGEAPPAPPAAAPARRVPARQAGPPWTWLRPGLTGNQLAGLALPGGSAGWAVGTRGTILRTVDGGVHWARQDGGTSADLLAVATAGSKAAWAVGPGGTVLATRDGGTSWQALATGRADTFFGVAAWGGSRVWVVGERGLVLYSENGGLTWTRQDAGTHENLYGITFVTRDHGWICGGDGRIRITADGGRHWIQQRTPTHKPLYSVAFADGRHGVAVGDDGTTLRTANSGGTWSQTLLAASDKLRAVRMASARRVYASGAQGTFLRSTDGGATWARLDLPLRGMCGALAVAAHQRVWTGGEGGRPCRSASGGDSWSPVAPGVSVSLRATAQAGGTLWLAGAHGTLLTQAGATAGPRAVSVPTTADLNGVAAAGSELWACGPKGLVLHRSGRGAWTRRAPTKRDLRAVAALGSGRGWVAGADGILLSTTDGGAHWASHAATGRDLACLAFTDQSHGWAGGGADEGEDHAFVLRTQDGGQSWQDVELPVWGRVLDLQFVDALHGWAAGEEWVRDGDVRAGVVLATADGGLTWQVQGRSEGVLDAVVMVDAQRGYAVGEEGAALETTDGGLTWTPADIGTDAALHTAVLMAPGQALVAGDGGLILTSPAQ